LSGCFFSVSIERRLADHLYRAGCVARCVTHSIVYRHVHGARLFISRSLPRAFRFGGVVPQGLASTSVQELLPNSFGSGSVASCYKVVALIAARLSGSSIRVRYRRHCKVSSDGRNLSRQADCQRSGSCRGFYIVRGDSKER
jgi:hypothetical protein